MPAGWTKNGCVIQQDGFAPSGVSEMLQAFRDGGGELQLLDGSLIRPNRWVLTPVLLAETIGERATLSVEARGGTTRLRTEDKHILRAGHIASGQVWYPLDSEACAELQNILDTGGLDLGPISLKSLLGLRSARLDKLTFLDRISEVSPEIFGELPTTQPAPTGITATLYPYQIIGWRWLQFLSRHEVGGLLADEMGLGKTLQIISLIADAGSTPLQAVMVVAPGTLLENWRRELARFAPALKVLIHQGPGRTGSPRELRLVDVVVTAYDTVVPRQRSAGDSRMGCNSAR